MKLFKLLLLTIAWALVIPMSHAISLDSILNLPAMGIPVVNYSPESTWEFGAAVQGYFCLPNQEKAPQKSADSLGTPIRTSIVQVDGTYSLRRQWYINAQGTLYFGKSKFKIHNSKFSPSWHLQFRAGYNNRPSTYYGIGNQGNTDIGMLREGTPMDISRGYLQVQAPIAVSQNWSVGPMVDFSYYHYIIERTETDIQHYAIGVVVQYDTRDRLFYPSSGIFWKASATQSYTFPQHTYTTLTSDLRHFIPLPCNLLIAWQMKTQWVIGKESAPYPLLPRLGGQDGIRGVNSDMFRDDVMMALQAELRIPIWSIFRGTIFAGIGDVYNLHHWQWAVPKVGYGVGLRAAINKAKVNIRFDIARSNVDPRWNNINAYSFYLTATEAF